MIEGRRPDKPGNASSIGFSDSLWDFVQRCWNGDKKLRPSVTGVVACLEKAAANWDVPMPPYAVAEAEAEAVAESVGVGSEETSGTEKYCEFDIVILPRYPSSNDGTGQIFPPSSPGTTSESPTESQPTHGPFSHQSTLSTECSEPPQEESQEVAAKPFSEPPSESRVSVQSLPEELKPEPPASIQSRSMSDSTEHRELEILVLLDIAHRAMVQMESFNHHRISTQRISLKDRRLLLYFPKSQGQGFGSPYNPNWRSHTMIYTTVAM